MYAIKGVKFGRAVLVGSGGGGKREIVVTIKVYKSVDLSHNSH
jgi:hypothetical protein